MKNKFLGATLMVAGSAIGAGMLGLPIATSFCGFYPSLLAMSITWFFLLLTSFILVDVNLEIPGESNLVSMAENRLGLMGKVIIWIAYLFLLYALDVAFLAGGSTIIKNRIAILDKLSPLIILLPIAITIFYGMKKIDLINRLMMIGKLGIGYLILIIFAPSHVQIANLARMDFSSLFFSLPIVLEAFGFHTIIPSLIYYLNRDGKMAKGAMALGSFLALLIYAFWQFIVLGTVPLTTLVTTFTEGKAATIPLIAIIHRPIISLGADIFAICAIGTAFLGVSLGLFDFLADGLRIKKTLKGRFSLSLLTFTPLLLFVYICPKIFITALKYAGFLACIVFGLMPICMAFTMSNTSFWKCKKGKVILIIATLFFIMVITSIFITKTANTSR